MFSDKRGITPVIATLLLIAITVAAVAGFYIFYNAFIKQSKVSGDNPSVTMSGPSTSDANEVVIVSVKNSGNVDLTSWQAYYGTTLLGHGTLLKVGSQRSFSQVVSGTGPWTFRATGLTDGGSQAEDLMVVEST